MLCPWRRDCDILLSGRVLAGRSKVAPYVKSFGFTVVRKSPRSFFSSSPLSTPAVIDVCAIYQFYGTQRTLEGCKRVRPACCVHCNDLRLPLSRQSEGGGVVAISNVGYTNVGFRDAAVQQSVCRRTATMSREHQSLEIASGPREDDPLVRVISDNPRHAAKEWRLSEMHIIGRVLRKFGVIG